MLLVFVYATYAQCSNPNAGYDIEVCGYTCNLNVTNVTTGFWTAYIGEVPILPAPIFNPSNTSPEAEFTTSFTESMQEIIFVWTDNSGPCTDTVVVYFYQRPVANAGPDNAVCGDQYVLGAEFSLPESTEYTPSGIWSTCFRPFPSSMTNIQPQTSITATVQVTDYGIYRFVFRENNSNLTMCYSTDTLQIEFLEVPIISAGEDRDVCGACTIMEGVSAGFGGTWLPNGAQFPDNDWDNPNGNTCVNTYGNRTYTWLESNIAQSNSTFACSSQDEVVITFWRKPTANILTSPEDSIACGLTYEHLRAENPGSGITGWWFCPYCGPSFDPYILDMNLTVSDYGEYDLFWIEETGPELSSDFCMDTAGPLKLYFVEKPYVSAGADAYLYGYNYQLNGEILIEDNPDFSMPISSLWQSDNASIDNPDNLSTNATVTEYGVYEFRIMTYYTDYSSCFDNDTVKITYINPIYFGVETENSGSTDLEIYPNPANTTLYFNFTESPEQITIIDINGRIVLTPQVTEKSIDISALQPGLYFVKIKTTNGNFVNKFVKE